MSTVVADMPELATVHPGPAVLRLEGITKTFHRGVWPARRSVAVLTGATLAVGAGELIGLVGANGSGKSTLLQIVRRAAGTRWRQHRATRPAGLLPAAVDAVGTS